MQRPRETSPLHRVALAPLHTRLFVKGNQVLGFSPAEAISHFGSVEQESPVLPGQVSWTRLVSSDKSRAQAFRSPTVPVDAAGRRPFTEKPRSVRRAITGTATAPDPTRVGGRGGSKAGRGVTVEWVRSDPIRGIRAVCPSSSWRSRAAPRRSPEPRRGWARSRSATPSPPDDLRTRRSWPSR